MGSPMYSSSSSQFEMANMWKRHSVQYNQTSHMHNLFDIVQAVNIETVKESMKVFSFNLLIAQIFTIFIRNVGTLQFRLFEGRLRLTLSSCHDNNSTQQFNFPGQDLSYHLLSLIDIPYISFNFSWVKRWAQPNFGFGFGLGWV